MVNWAPEPIQAKTNSFICDFLKCKKKEEKKFNDLLQITKKNHYHNKNKQKQPTKTNTKIKYSKNNEKQNKKTLEKNK